MSQKRLKKLIYIERTILVFLILILIGFLYLTIIDKNTFYQITVSILVIICSIAMIFIQRLKIKIQINIGLIRAYGESIVYDYLVQITMAIGLISIIFGLLTLNDVNKSIFKFTSGFIWILLGFSKRLRYNIKITEKGIIRLDREFIKIKSIILILFLSDRILLKTKKRTIEIFFADLNYNEKELIIKDLEKIKLKNNLA